LRRAVLLSVLLVLSFVVAPAGAAGPRFVSGQAAQERLGSRLGDVARAHGLTAAKLKRLLRTDPTVNADTSGHLVFLDRGTPAALPTRAASAPLPLADTFTLHTDPGASRILYLDFDGGTYSPGAPPKTPLLSSPVTIPPYGDNATFSDDTLAEIQLIWQIVAEDYAPFQLDVTTQEPSEADLEDCSDTCGARISIGGTSTAAGFPSGVLGIAPLGVSFGVDTLPTAFVFSDSIGDDVPNVAYNISHESGHTFSLLHDGVTPNDPADSNYFSGFGDWCPIMGDCSTRPLSQWSKGEYPNANNQEDDLAIIGAIAPERADDVPGTAPLGGTPDAVNQAGLIGDRADTDTFTFASGDGPATFTVTGAPPAPNLDASLTLLDSQGAVIATADDPNSLGATVTSKLPAGVYSLRVDGVGNAVPSPGYSDYDSLGRYSITGSYTPVAPPPTEPTPTPNPPPVTTDAPPPPAAPIATPAAQPKPSVKGRATRKATTLRLFCGDRLCTARVSAAVVRKSKKLGTLRGRSKKLAADRTVTLKLAVSKKLRHRLDHKRHLRVQVRVVFSYADGTRLVRNVVLRLH
jgi:hypothetical protein